MPVYPEAAAMEQMSREEFGEFYNHTAPALRRYLIRIGGKADLADDLLQEAYIRLIHAAPAGQTQRRAYLYRTATNLLLDHLRAGQRERIGLALWKWLQPAAATTPEPPTGFERVLQMLALRERAMLWLAYVDELSHAEIATALGCGEKSVRVLLFRARRKLERLLRDHNIDSGELR